MTIIQHNQYMELALAQAALAKAKDEVPVGAVVVYKDKVIGSGHNLTRSNNNAMCHAEMIALAEASKTLGSEKLLGCTLYVTLEPCPMCAGAMVLARLSQLVYGAMDPKMGAAGTLVNIVNNLSFNHRVQVLGGIMEAECVAILQDFFRSRRDQPQQNKHGVVSKRS